MEDQKPILKLREEIVSLKIENKELKQKLKEYQEFYESAVKENKRLRKVLMWKGIRLKLNKLLGI